MAEIELTKENFEQEVLKSDKPVVVDFWASWCGPCKMMASVIEQFAKDYEGKYVVGKVNVDLQEELAQQYDIMGVPTIMVFKNGKKFASSTGYMPADLIIKLIGEN